VAVSREFRERVVELFATFGDVKIKLMFGAAGIYFKDQMFGVVAGETIYLKANDKTRGDFEAEGLAPFTFETKSGETITTSYIEVPPRLLDDPDELARWARRAYEAAIASRAKKKKPARKNAPPRDLPLVTPKKSAKKKPR
jgi:DNA transformation protein and related proteins